MVINQAALTAISKTFNIQFQEALKAAPSDWQKIAMRAPSTTRSNDYRWMGNIPQLQEWLGDRPMSALKAFGYAITNKTWANGIEVLRDDIEDDNLGVYAPAITAVGEEAGKHKDKLIFALLATGFAALCYDGQPFFDTDHPVGEGDAATTYSNSGGGAGTAWYLLCTAMSVKPLIMQVRREPEFTALDNPTDSNVFERGAFKYGADWRGQAGFGLWQLAYGSKQTLDATNYSAARAAMMGFKSETGSPLGIVPNLLLVPPSLEEEGRKLLLSDRDDAGATNPWKATAELMVSPWLA